MQVGFRLDAIDTSTDDHRDIILELSAPSSYGDCSLRDDQNTGQKSLIVLHIDQGYDGTGVTPLFATGTDYVATYSRGASSRCAIPGTVHEITDTVTQFSTTPTILLQHMQVTLHHVTVYQVVQ